MKTTWFLKPQVWFKKGLETLENMVEFQQIEYLTGKIGLMSS